MSKLREDGVEDFSPEMFNTEDVVFDMPPTKNRRKVYLVATSESDFNLVKFYLALKAYLEKIERELNLMEDAPDDPQ